MEGLTFLRGQARFEGPDTDPRRRGAAHRAADLPQCRRAGLGAADLPGVDKVPFLNNSSMLALEELPAHLLVVGGSYIGLEFAQMYRRFGSRGDGGRAAAAADRPRG